MTKMGAGAVVLAALAVTGWLSLPGPGASPGVPSVSPRGAVVAARPAGVSAARPVTVAAAPAPRALTAPPSALPAPAVEATHDSATIAARDAAPEVQRVPPGEVPLSGHPAWMRRVLRSAASDPDAALAWAASLPDPERRRDAAQAICSKVAERDPRAALEMAVGAGLEDAPAVVENLVAQWAAVDPGGTLEWIDRRPPGDARDGLVARVAFAQAANQPADALLLIEQRMAPGMAQSEAAAAVFNRWWTADARMASEWSAGLSDGALRDRVRQELDVLAAAPR